MSSAGCERQKEYRRPLLLLVMPRKTSHHSGPRHTELRSTDVDEFGEPDADLALSMPKRQSNRKTKWQQVDVPKEIHNVLEAQYQPSYAQVVFAVRHPPDRELLTKPASCCFRNGPAIGLIAGLTCIFAVPLLFVGTSHISISISIAPASHQEPINSSFATSTVSPLPSASASHQERINSSFATVTVHPLQASGLLSVPPVPALPAPELAPPLLPAPAPPSLPAPAPPLLPVPPLLPAPAPPAPTAPLPTSPPSPHRPPPPWSPPPVTPLAYWQVYEHTNCWWDGHGATEIDSPKGATVPGVDSLIACLRSCTSFPNYGCEAVLWDPTHLRCYRKAGIVLEECDPKSFSVNLYMRTDKKPPSPPIPPVSPPSPPAQPSPPSPPSPPQAPPAPPRIPAPPQSPWKPRPPQPPGLPPTPPLQPPSPSPLPPPASPPTSPLANWQVYEHTNCWGGGYGATEIDHPKFSNVAGVDSLIACLRSCVNFPNYGCEAVEWEYRQRKCFRKANIFLVHCEHGPGVTLHLYVRTDVKPPSPPTPPALPPAPPALPITRLSHSVCQELWQNKSSRFHDLWSEAGWKVRKPGEPGCWGGDGSQYWDDAWWGRACSRNWYTGTPGFTADRQFGHFETLGPSDPTVSPHFTKAAPALLGFDETIDVYCDTHVRLSCRIERHAPSYKMMHAAYNPRVTLT